MKEERVTLLLRLLSGLLQVPCGEFGEDRQALDNFSRQHSFQPQLQPLLSPQSLEEDLCHLPQARVWELRDGFGLRLLMFRFQEARVLLGPFVTEEWNDSKCHTLLARKNLADSYLIPYKLYYTRYPIVQVGEAVRVIQCVAESIQPDIPIYRHRLLGEKEKRPGVLLQPEPPSDFEMAVERYDRENRLIDLVRLGDTQGALQALRSLNPMAAGMRYDVLANNGVTNIGVVRTLLRKAAEAGGVHPAVVDSISQAYAQKANAARSPDELARLTPQMVRDYCAAVRETNREQYPPAIKRTVEYIRLNLSQSMSLSRLGEVAGMTPNYLSHAFKDATGMSVTQYIARKRCEKAAALLRTSQLSVQDISNYVGYPDSNYFVKIFRAQMGTTPSQYRKNTNISQEEIQQQP